MSNPHFSLLVSTSSSWQRTFVAIFCRTDLDKAITIAKPDWETYCQKVADMIVQEQSPQRVMDVRAKLYELLSHCIPPTVILKVG